MFVTSSTLGGGTFTVVIPSSPDVNGDYIDNVYIYSTSPPEQISLKYFHATNSNNAAQGSNIDGTAPEILFNNLSTTVNGTTSGVFHNDQSGAALFGSLLSSNVLPQITYKGQTNYTRNYTASFSLFIPPFGSQNDFQTGTRPADFLATECLTDRLIIEGRPKLNNPNIRTATENSLVTLGNTGWFNENYNGNKTDFTATIAYTDVTTGTALSALNTAGATSVSITVSGVTSFNGVYSMGFGFVPADASDISNLLTPYHENINLVYKRALTVGSGISTGYSNGYGADPMQSQSDYVQQVGSDLVFSIDLQPSSGLATKLATAAEEDKKYFIFVCVDNGQLDAAQSKRTTLLADYNTMAEYIAPAGAWGHNLDVLNRNQAATDSEIPCDLDTKIEDTIIFKSSFFVGATVPDRMAFRVIAENTTTGQQYNLEQTSINLSQFPTVGGIPQFNYTAQRGFLTNVSDLDTITILRNAAADTGGTYAYTAAYPIKIRWESWISRLNVPSDFYDITKPSNGLNNNWYHYLTTLGWDFKLVVDTYVGSTRYEDSRWIVFNDYEDNATITPTFAYYRQSNGATLNGGTDAATGTPLGVILEEDVRIEVTFTRVSGTWVPGDLANLYSLLMIEIENGAGFLSQHEISTTTAPLSAAPLQPLSGETGLKFEYINTTQIKVSCLIKPTLLERATRYKITARLGCK